MKKIVEKQPNFLVIGAAKSGTTSIHNYLLQHPDIYMPKDKETRFFAIQNDSSQTFSYNSIASYLSLYQDVSDEKAIGEACTTYIYSSKAARRIRDFNPSMRIIAFLRNPIDRAYSQFNYYIREGREIRRNFNEIVYRELELIEDYVQKTGYHPHSLEDEHLLKKSLNKKNELYLIRGMYSLQLQNFLKHFPKEQIKVILFEDLKENPDLVFSQLFEFLDVNNDFRPNTRIHNETYIPGSGLAHRIYSFMKHQEKMRFYLSQNLPSWLFWGVIEPVSKKFLNSLRRYNSQKPEPIGHDLRKKLIGFYSEDIKNLQESLGTDLSEWLN